MIVFNDLIPASGNTAHNRAPFYFRLSENAAELAGLPLRTQASFYASAILGMPRILLSMLRHNLPIIPSKVVSTGPFTNMASPALRLGSLAVPVVFGQTIRPDMPQTCASPADVCVYSEATKQSFHFSTDPIWPMQAPFARKIAALAKAHHVELVCLHMPTMDETNSSVIEESAYWPDFCQGNVSIIGIPPDKLFRGMKEQGTLKLFYNLEHLNQNGQEYFTKLITPSLVQLYENKINP
jgi:hypothetical protein